MVSSQHCQLVPIPWCATTCRGKSSLLYLPNNTAIPSRTKPSPRVWQAPADDTRPIQKCAQDGRGRSLCLSPEPYATPCDVKSISSDLLGHPTASRHPRVPRKDRARHSYYPLVIPPSISPRSYRSFRLQIHPIMMCVRCKYAAACVCDGYARRVRMRAVGRRESS